MDLFEVVSFRGHQQSDDEAEKSQDGAEDLNDEDLDESSKEI